MRVKGHSGRSNATFLSPTISDHHHHHDDNPSFTRRRRWNLLTTTVSCATSAATTTTPWPYATTSTTTLLHPLTLQPHTNLPQNPNFRNFELTPLTSFHHTDFSFEKLVVIDDVMLVLYGGGRLFGRLPLIAGELSPDWETLSEELLFDDVVVFRGKVYVVDRLGKLYVINCNVNSRRLSLGQCLISRQITPWFGRFGWRKRLLVDERDMYVVVRVEEEVFRVYKFIRRQKKSSSYWVEVKGFCEGRVLFVSKDCGFFVDGGFGGREYDDCVVFCETGFPKYTVKGRWVYSGEDEIRVFRLTDGSFGNVGESDEFPEIDWSPPSWVFYVGSGLSSPSRIQSERVQSDPKHSNSTDEGEDEVMELDSDSEDQEHGAEQSDLKHSNSIDEEEYEVMELDSDSEDQEHGAEQSDPEHLNNKDEEEHEVMELDSDSEVQNQGERKSDSDIQDPLDGNLQCDADSHEKEVDEEMQSNGNIEVDASLQEDVPTSIFDSISSDEAEATRIILHMNGGNEAVEEESSRENITPSVHEACTSSTTKSFKSDSATAKFEGFDIRADLVPTLQKIWRKHGNIIENSTIRSGDIIAMALESLATVVQILDNDSVESLTDCQADYLSASLSDLRCMCFNVNWLSSFVEKAVKLHKSKALVGTLNKLSQLSSRVKERGAVLLDEIAKLTKEENKLKAEMTKVSKLIPFSGQIKLDEPLGTGLT